MPDKPREVVSAGETEDSDIPETLVDEEALPGPSKMRYVAIFLAGLFIGRIASENFAPGSLGALDLFMYLGLALSIAWAWRSWARRAMIQRHLSAERRKQATAQRAPGSSRSKASRRR